MTIKTLYGILVLIGLLTGAGFTTANLLGNKADKEDIKTIRSEILAVNAKSDYILDTQQEALIKKIDRLETQKGKSQEEIIQLQYWREQLEESRKIRRQQLEVK